MGQEVVMVSFFHSHSRNYTAWYTVLLQGWDVYTVQAQFITSLCVSRLSHLPNVCTSGHRLLQECTSSHRVCLLKVQEVGLSGLLLFDTMVINETQNQSFCQSIIFFPLVFITSLLPFFVSFYVPRVSTFGELPWRPSVQSISGIEPKVETSVFKVFIIKQSCKFFTLDISDSLDIKSNGFPAAVTCNNGFYYLCVLSNVPSLVIPQANKLLLIISFFFHFAFTVYIDHLTFLPAFIGWVPGAENVINLLVPM